MGIIKNLSMYMLLNNYDREKAAGAQGEKMVSGYIKQYKRHPKKA